MTPAPDRIRTLLRFGTYAACAILSAVSIKTTAFGLAMILPGSLVVAYVVSIVLQMIIVSASWLFFSRFTGRIDRDSSWVRGIGLLVTCAALWFIGAFFSVAGSYLAFDQRLSDTRRLSLTEHHEAEAMMFGSKVAGQLAERASFARARDQRLARLRDDEREGRISGQSGCFTLCRGLTDRVSELEGLIARLDALTADLERCPVEDIRCAQTVLDRATATDPLVERILVETAEFLKPWRGERYLPEDWTQVAFTAAPAPPALRAATPERLAGIKDLLALRTESLSALFASLAIEILLVVIACLGVLLVPSPMPAAAAQPIVPTPAPIPDDPLPEPAEPTGTVAPATRTGSRKAPARPAYTAMEKRRLVHVATRLSKQGRSIREVADVLAVPRSTLTRWLRRAPRRSNVLPLEQNAENSKWLGAVARRLHQKGTPAEAVAQTLDVPAQTVVAWLEIGDEPETNPALGQAV